MKTIINYLILLGSGVIVLFLTALYGLGTITEGLALGFMTLFIVLSIISALILAMFFAIFWDELFWEFTPLTQGKIILATYRGAMILFLLNMVFFICTFLEWHYGYGLISLTRWTYIINITLLVLSATIISQINKKHHNLINKE